VNAEPAVEDMLRELAPQVLGGLVRRHGQFDACEDAVQEALLAAARQWPADVVPDRPRSWLLTVAGRSLVDAWRAEGARRRRELSAALLEPAGREPVAGRDDTLALLYLCCHPALSGPSQLALTLRAVGGLTTAEIAAAFLVPEAAMAKRISRAKQHIRNAGARFELPARPQRTERLGVVLQVLYLIFNEGYTTSSGPGPTPRRSDHRGHPASPPAAPTATRGRRAEVTTEPGKLVRMRVTSGFPFWQGSTWEWELGTASRTEAGTSVLFRHYGFADGYAEIDLGHTAQTTWWN